MTTDPKAIQDLVALLPKFQKELDDFKGISSTDSPERRDFIEKNYNRYHPVLEALIAGISALKSVGEGESVVISIASIQQAASAIERLTAERDAAYAQGQRDMKICAYDFYYPMLRSILSRSEIYDAIRVLPIKDFET
jgi:hypothetical protein